MSGGAPPTPSRPTRDRHDARRVSPARKVADEVLRRVEEEGAYASVLLTAAAEGLRTDDRALAYELTLGVLRRQLWLDRAVEHFAGERKVATLDAPVRRALRIGLYQLRFLTRIPPSAAVNESVNLVHFHRLRSAAGFVNAVLRRAAREPQYDPTLEATNSVERAAIETSHPAWMIERWTNAFGPEEAAAFARANNATAPIAFRVNPRRAGEASVTERLNRGGVTIAPSLVAPHAWRVERGDVAEALQSMARAGEIYVQDESSQAAAAALEAQLGERVLDVCAAPGGKTTQIGIAIGGDDGRRGSIIAGDFYAHRLRTVREAARRQNLSNVIGVRYDATRPLPLVENSFDRVLVDAPCSGTGTLRRNPEIRWRITPGDFIQLVARQRSILENAAPTVRHGGRLVYSTCSVEREENEDVVRGFLARHADFRLSAERRLWPHREGSDGFFLAVLEKVG